MTALQVAWQRRGGNVKFSRLRKKQRVQRLGVPVSGTSGGRTSIGFESRSFHAAPRFRTLHESVPDKAGSRVLCHEHGDSRIDSNTVAVVPLFKRIECVHKSVLTPGGWISLPDGSQNPHCGLRQKRQRTRGRAGYNGAVNGPRCRRSAPNDVAMFRVRGGYAPQIIAVIGKLGSQLQTETPVDIRGDNRVLEVVRILVFLPAKIEPGLRILVYE